jgi:hypothetical protein
VFRGMRQGKIERIEEGRRTGAHRRGRISLGRAADWRSSGELLRQPGGTVWRGRKGKEERRSRAFIGAQRGEETAGIKREIIWGGELLREKLSPARSTRGRRS